MQGGEEARQMAGPDSVLPASSLLCQEDTDACLSDGDADENIGFSAFPGDEHSCLTVDEHCPCSDDDEYIDGLITRETTFGGSGRVVSAGAADGGWLQNARVDAVRWILRMHALFGFGPETAYLAVNFLDRFLVKRTIESRHQWAIQLLSVACLSVAAKLEECRVPALSEFRFNEFRFDAKAIMRMELLVLTTLEWRLRSVTPFPYLSYLVSRTKRGRSQPLSRRDIMVRATSFLFSAIESMRSVDFRPSVMATAAFCAASGQALTTGRVLELDCEAGVVASLSASLQLDQLFSCYSLILECWNSGSKLVLDKKTTPSVPVDDDGNPLRPMESDDHAADLISSTHSSSIQSKRRRLALKGYCSCHCSISTGTGNSNNNNNNKGGSSIQLD